MQSRCAVRFRLMATWPLLGFLVCALSLPAQTSPVAPPQSISNRNTTQPASNSGQQNIDQFSPVQIPGANRKAPAIITVSGPAISFDTSESIFDVMAGLNACGYNEGLSTSDPLRQKVRDDMNQALMQSAAARDSRDRLCAFIRTHTLNGESLNLAAYISLALYLTPPPALTPNVATSDLPPDAGPLVGVLPYLRDFSRTINLHLIWALNRSAYDAEIATAHVPFSKMLVQMDLYLRQPPPTYGARRFVVILEPLIAPGEVNARVYGGNYIVVESPVNGHIDLKPVKHTYLRFVLEPLIYARSTAIDKLTPILELVQPSPLPYIYKSDVLTLVTECMIRAIEAHTMDTGVPVYKIPAHFGRNQAVAINNAENEYERKVHDVKRAKIVSDMEQGFILTKYFYDQFKIFQSSSSTTLQQAVGEMVYGMNADIERHRVEHIVFASHTDQDVAQSVSPQSAELDEGERKLMTGDTAGAAQLAQEALAQHTPYPGRALFILARADIMNGKMNDAVQAFQRAINESHNLRTISWSHIYLGRLDDLQGDRASAIKEYQAAMVTRDGKPDTKEAAEQGLKAPFAPPQSAQQQDSGQNGGAGNPQSDPQSNPQIP